jgi:hypothetical protein
MKDLSCHILDIVQNSIHAGASRVEMDVNESTQDGKLILTITDNGCGMNSERILQVTDPFFTTSETKKVGLGLPLLKQNAEQTGGSFGIDSVVNKGTVVKAVFNTSNIDMIPMGDLASTMKTLIACDPGKDFVYRHRKDDSGFDLDTSQIRAGLDGMNLGNREVLDYIADYVRTSLKELDKPGSESDHIDSEKPPQWSKNSEAGVPNTKN